MNNNNQIVIFFASVKEANSLLFHSELKFTKLSNNEYFIPYKEFKINLIITGIGKKCIKTIKNLNFNEILFAIKAGACAVIDKNFELCRILIPSSVFYKNRKFDILLSGMPHKIKKYLEKYTVDAGLITIANPLINSRLAKEYHEKGFIAVDMESFYIKKKFSDIPLIPLLIGTDRGDKNSIISFFKNLSAASRLLCEVILELLESL